jgi:hypothetical protein
VVAQELPLRSWALLDQSALLRVLVRAQMLAHQVK